MKKMIALACFVAASAASISVLGAEARPAKSPTWDQRVRQARQAVIGQRLHLTPEQQVQARTIRTRAAAAAQAARADAALSPEQRRQRIAEAFRTAQTDWRALLTPEQKQQLKQLLAHPHELNQRARERVRAAAVQTALALTAEQQGKLRAVRAERAAALKALQEDGALPAEQKATKRRELMQASRRQIETMLTPAQKTKLARMRARLLAPLGVLG